MVMDETNNNQQGNEQASSGKDKQATSSDGQGGSTSQKTYSEAQVVEMINKVKSDMTAELGRKYKPMEEQNRTLTVQLQSSQSELTGLKSQVSKLTEQLDIVTNESDDALKLAKRMRTLDGEATTLKKDREELDNRIAEYEPRFEAADKYMLESNVRKVAERFKDPDAFKKLLPIANSLFDKTEDGIKKVADNLGWELVQQAPAGNQGNNQNMDLDDGRDESGGGFNVSTATPEQKVAEGLRRERLKRN